MKTQKRGKNLRKSDECTKNNSMKMRFAKCNTTIEKGSKNYYFTSYI